MNKKSYSKNKHCKCGKLICNVSKQCRKCYGIIRTKTMKGNNAPFFKDGRCLKKYYCIDCKKKLKGTSACNHKRCKKCYHLSKKGKENYHKKDCNCMACKMKRKELHGKKNYMFKIGNKHPLFGKKGHFNKNTITKHHILLEQNSHHIIKISHSKHRKLHLKAYEYIYIKYGWKGILEYLKWFKKKYGFFNKRGRPRKEKNE